MSMMDIKSGNNKYKKFVFEKFSSDAVKKKWYVFILWIITTQLKESDENCSLSTI